MITLSIPMKGECPWAMRAAGCRQVNQQGFQLQLLALTEVLVDAAMLLCFCSLRGLAEQGDPGQRQMLCTGL